jgi:hypothetical protein
MSCAEIDILICDYVDGTLDEASRATVEAHLAECPACVELVKDSKAAVEFMQLAADVEPPAELVNRILFAAPWGKGKSESAPRRWIRAILSPILQPRFAMGIALTMLSLSIVAQGRIPKLRPSDLEPAKVWSRLETNAEYAWDRTVVYFNRLKLVYQIESMLHDWQQQSDEQPAPAPKTSQQKTDERKLPVRTDPGQAAPSSSTTGGSR